MKNTVLQLEDVYAGYGKSIVLNGVSLRLPEGVCAAIIGPNGAGKTTLLRVMAGLLKPIRGRLVAYNRVNPSATELARIAAYVPQNPVGAPRLTVIEYIAMHRVVSRGAWRVKNEDLEAAEEALRLLGIEHLAGRRVEELSGGQRKLVDIAAAIARRPKILLLDEPTAPLDVRNQVELLDVLLELTRRERMITVMVIHDINLAIDYADVVVLMNAGRVAVMGNPREVLDPEILEKVYRVPFRRVMLEGRPRLLVVARSGSPRTAAHRRPIGRLGGRGEGA